MPVLLEVLAAILVANLLLWLVYRIYRKFRPLPLINLTITRVRSTYNPTYYLRCLLCGADLEVEIERSAIRPRLNCPICGEGGSLRRVQDSMRRRLLLKRQKEQQEEADKMKAEKAEHDSIKEGGRKLDL